jgi:lipid II:glycine glycyltransferase (peptidoglycan interpeptide bridge formation enzyme)
VTLSVRAITAAQHSDWIGTRSSVSFLQLPEWGRLKTGWRSESLGWFEGSTLVGAGLVLYRPVPRLPQRSLAYLPEGPDIDWLREDHPHLTLDDWLAPMRAHCSSAGAFQVKMGPPVALRRWEADTIKAAMAQRQAGQANPPVRLSEVLADWHSGPGAKLVERLASSGWSQEPATDAGFGDVQPRYVFQVALAERTLDDIFAGFNQLWRRNVRKAEKAKVVVTQGGRDDLAAFHAVYVETAARDHFTPRGLAYFERMWDCLATIGRMRLYLAHHDDHLAAATIMVHVGDHAWYSYGASTTADRDVRPSNALQWRMISDAHALGCATYDLRGIADTLDPENHLFGLVQFKVGTGGFAQEYAGEWDYVLRPLWAKGFRTYQSRRG